jgi:hypothetical protein
MWRLASRGNASEARSRRIGQRSHCPTLNPDNEHRFGHRALNRLRCNTTLLRITTSAGQIFTGLRTNEMRAFSAAPRHTKRNICWFRRDRISDPEVCDLGAARAANFPRDRVSDRITGRLRLPPCEVRSPDVETHGQRPLPADFSALQVFVECRSPELSGGTASGLSLTAVNVAVCDVGPCMLMSWRV